MKVISILFFIISILFFIIRFLQYSAPISLPFKNSLINYSILIKNESFNECFYFINNNIISTQRRQISNKQYILLNNNRNIIKLNTIKFNNKFNIIKKLSIKRGPRGFYGPEDTRIIELNNEIILIYNDIIDGYIKLCLYNLNSKNNKILEYDEASKVEKNWSPFIYNNELYVSQHINPHIILKVDIYTGKCDKVYSNEKYEYKYKIYGGTPSILFEQLDFYFGIAHTNTLGFLGHKRNYYCIGYLFNAKPPFNLIKISEPFTFFYRNDEHTIFTYQNVEFPIGLQKVDDDLLISLGINDKISYLLKINYNKLFSQIF
jgi:predicted GH43/DUF377 family glycosyl hydrolase